MRMSWVLALFQEEVVVDGQFPGSGRGAELLEDESAALDGLADELLGYLGCVARKGLQRFGIRSDTVAAELRIDTDA